MKIFAFYFLLIFTICSYGQKRVKSYQLYTENGLTHKKEDGALFTGICEYKKEKKNHLVFETFYTNGWKSKYIEYYNTDKVIACEEIVYHENSNEKKKASKFSSDGKQKSFTYFDLKGKKELEESYEDDKLIYRCEYLNGRKHGKEFCITKKCDNHTELYENGKKIK